MPDISIQFHALPKEVLSFAHNIITDLNLHVTVVRFHPFEAHELPNEELDHIQSIDTNYKRMYFTITKPILPASNELDFADKNPDSLRLDVGSLEESGLRESWLSARTENLQVVSVWKQIAKKLRGLTKPGGTSVHPKTGATAPAKSHRFSEGAKELELSGVPLLAINNTIMKPHSL